MEIKKIDNEIDLWFAQQLYLKSFPEVERREVGEWIYLTQNEPIFHNNIIKEDNQNAGFITYWDFPDFVYAEHFAVDVSMRGNGIGGKALDMFFKHVRKPVVLEVELPTGEMECRRIGFYKRHGLVLSEKKYMQPSYNVGGQGVELKIMSYNFDNLDSEYEKVINMIYKYVYKNKSLL